MTEEDAKKDESRTPIDKAIAKIGEPKQKSKNDKSNHKDGEISVPEGIEDVKLEGEDEMRDMFDNENIFVDEDDVNPLPETTVQSSGRGYLIRIPKKISENLGLDKGDKFSWDAIKGDDEITIIINKHEDEDIRLPLEER